MFGFVDFRQSPVIRLFPSVADAHQTSAFRAWTMGEPYREIKTVEYNEEDRVDSMQVNEKRQESEVKTQQITG